MVLVWYIPICYIPVCFIPIWHNPVHYIPTTLCPHTFHLWTAGFVPSLKRHCHWKCVHFVPEFIDCMNFWSPFFPDIYKSFDTISLIFNSAQIFSDQQEFFADYCTVQPVHSEKKLKIFKTEDSAFLCFFKIFITNQWIGWACSLT
jgi:hypothetical protein